MNDGDIHGIIHALRENLESWGMPIVSHLAEEEHDPFEILISTILSLRTKDEVTAAATDRLFRLADTPARMLELSEDVIAKAIYPVGFYRKKAGTIREICGELISRFDAKVPDDIDVLLTLRGVGRKTANLVVSLAYGKPGMCVDTHVHRISNRLGYVSTKAPGETEFVLREKLPRPYWPDYNTLMVTFGRQVCRPVSPLCSQCPVSRFCDRKNVARSR
jgi:endonuclease-3